MSQISESGHGKNVANFEDLISFCTGYGAAYNPSKGSIKISALNAALTNARNALLAVTNALTAFNLAVNARRTAFLPLSKLSVRILNALSATDASELTIDDAKGIVRKINGRRASEKLPSLPDDPNTPENETHASISASQKSYDSQVEHFSRLKDLLANEPSYLPNESDLKVASLNTLIADLKVKKTALLTAATLLSNARISRNDILFKKDTGLTDFALEVKSYVKSVFGSSSPQFKQISRLSFSRK